MSIVIIKTCNRWFKKHGDELTHSLILILKCVWPVLGVLLSKRRGCCSLVESIRPCLVVTIIPSEVVVSSKILSVLRTVIRLIISKVWVLVWKLLCKDCGLSWYISWWWATVILSRSSGVTGSWLSRGTLITRLSSRYSLTRWRLCLVTRLIRSLRRLIGLRTSLTRCIRLGLIGRSLSWWWVVWCLCWWVILRLCSGGLCWGALNWSCLSGSRLCW